MLILLHFGVLCVLSSKAVDMGAGEGVHGDGAVSLLGGAGEVQGDTQLLGKASSGWLGWFLLPVPNH